MVPLLDHLIRPCEERRRNRQPKCPGGLEGWALCHLRSWQNGSGGRPRHHRKI